MLITILGALILHLCPNGTLLFPCWNRYEYRVDPRLIRPRLMQFWKVKFTCLDTFFLFFQKSLYILILFIKLILRKEIYGLKTFYIQNNDIKYNSTLHKIKDIDFSRKMWSRQIFCLNFSLINIYIRTSKVSSTKYVTVLSEKFT